MTATQAGNPSPTWRLGHRPALDGLRGVAILLVLVSHAAAGLDVSRYHALGSSGVTVFFVLSGFLITSLLIEERARTGRTALGAFYARRARRLLPALGALLVVLGPLMVVGGRPWTGLLAVLLYASNWASAAGANLLPLTHTWSLAVEEQFYLVWPVVFILARGRVLLIAALGTLASVGAMVYLVTSGAPDRRIDFGTDVHACSLLLGCLLAAAAHRGLRQISSRPLLYGSLAVLAGTVAIHPERWTGAVDARLIVAASLVSAVALWTACGTRADPLLTWSVLRYTGRRSYALYLWHPPILIAAWALLPGSIATVVGVAASFGVAELSWRLVERRFLIRRPDATRTGGRQARSVEAASVPVTLP